MVWDEERQQKRQNKRKHARASTHNNAVGQTSCEQKIAREKMCGLVAVTRSDTTLEAKSFLVTQKSGLHETAGGAPGAYSQRGISPSNR